MTPLTTNTRLPGRVLGMSILGWRWGAFDDVHCNTQGSDRG